MFPSQHLDRNTVVLVPDGAVVDPDISARHVKSVSVEGSEVDYTVVIFVGSASTEHKTEMARIVLFLFFSLQPDLAIADF